MTSPCSLLYGRDFHYLDHIAPLSSLLDIPLMFTDCELEALAKEYYPNLKTKLLSPLNFATPILKESDVLFSCLPKQMVDPLFFFDEHLLRKKLLPIWLPHGNSDKDNLGALVEEKIILAYGDQMIDVLKKKGVLDSLFCVIRIGNFRRQFYERHRLFYDRLLAKKFYFTQEAPILLYAPTWSPEDEEGPIVSFLTRLPDRYNALIKLHPNTTSKGFFLSLKERYSQKKNIRFIDEIPTIYPLLAKTSIYIGDHSSIAYDFLSFDRPLFFLSKKSSTIHHTGQTVSLETLFSALEEPDLFSEARRSVYDYAFDKNILIDSLPPLIKKGYEDYFQEEIHLL